MITKAQLQAENEDDLLSRSRSKPALVTALTSGSSGRPFRTYRDPGWSAGAPAISCGRWRRPATGWATIS